MTVWPIVLSHEHIHRILDRRATLLILNDTRFLSLLNDGRTMRTAGRLKPGVYDVQDASAIRSNTRAVRQGHLESRADPFVFTIDIVAITEAPLVDLEFPILYSAGYRTFEEFYVDWLARHRRIRIDQEVNVAVFEIEADARYLAANISRGYTRDPNEAAEGEPEALSPAELADVSRRTAEDRAARVAAFRAETLAKASALAAGVDGKTRRQLRNVARITKSLGA